MNMKIMSKSIKIKEIFQKLWTLKGAEPPKLLYTFNKWLPKSPGLNPAHHSTYFIILINPDMSSLLYAILLKAIKTLQILECLHIILHLCITDKRKRNWKWFIKILKASNLKKNMHVWGLFKTRCLTVLFKIHCLTRLCFI